MKKNKKSDFKKLFILFLIVVGLIAGILNLNKVFDSRSDARVNNENPIPPKSTPTKKPIPKPTSVVGMGCCSDRECNPTCASLNCMVNKCRNAILCKSGGNGHGTCIKK